MTEEIVALEEAFNRLLSNRSLEKRPAKELLAIASQWSDAVWEVGKSLGTLPVSSQQQETAFQLCRKPVFICGVHRSGTTLVRDLLDNHPELTVLPSEGSYLTNLEPRIRYLSEVERTVFLGKEWLRRLANPINQPPYWLLGRSTSTDSPYVHFVRNFRTWSTQIERRLPDNRLFGPLLSVVLAYAASVGELVTKQWVDKTPTNERFIKRIWSKMPEARIIHVIRNPYAVLASRKEMEPALNMCTFLKELATSFRVAHQFSNGKDSRYLLLRYEELCSEPECTARRLSEFLGIDPMPCLLQPTVAGRLSAANSSFTRDAPEGRILVREHKAIPLLTAAEIDLLAAHIGRLANQMGYPMAILRAVKAQFLKMKCHVRAAILR